jgi:flagellin-like hook-associated protein FlgL
MTRIANSASTTHLVNLLLRSQRAINEAQVQLTSDKVSQNYAGIARESQRLVGFENATSSIERFTRNNELMDLHLQLTTTALTGVELTVNNFRQALLEFSNLDRTNEEAVASMQSNAWRSLRSLEGHLNADINGQYLFAGSRTTTPPVDFGVATLDVLQNTWNGDTITYPTAYENNVHPRLNAWSGSPDDPTNTGFGRLSFSGGLGGTITSDTAGYQTDTITLTGTVQDGDEYTVTVDGTTLTYTVTGAEADLATVRSNIISAINIHPAISPLVNASTGGSDGEIILISDTPGTAFTASVTASNLPAIAQIDTITIAGTPQAGDQYTLTVDGTAITYTADGTEGTLAGLRTAITAAINANSTVAAIVTASDSAVAGEIYLTAKNGNTSFSTTLVGATDIGNVAQVETVTISTGSSEANDVFSTTVAGIAYPYTTVGVENQDTIATGLAALIDVNPALNASAVGAIITITAAVAGTPYTSASTNVTDFDSGGDALTATAAVSQVNIILNADNTATSATTQLPEAGGQPAIAQVDNVTLSMAFTASDTIAINIDGLGAEIYTVTGQDMTANGDGTGGSATDAQARTNIATQIAAAIADNPTLSAVVTATSSGGAIVLTAVNAGITFTTASTVKDVTSSGNGQKSTITTPTANYAGGIPAVAQVDNVTMTGTFAAGDVVSINVDGIGVVTYNVAGTDLTDNGATSGFDPITHNNIAIKLAAAVVASTATAAVVTATAPGLGVVRLTAVTAGTAFSTVAGEITAGSGVATGTTPTANAATIISNADNTATIQSVTASQNPFANIPIGASITIAGATESANNVTYTVAANTGTVITVALTQTVVSSGGSDNSSSLTMSSDISYYSGDEIARTHQTSKTREFSLDTTAIDPAIEKAVRAMFIVAQGVYGTDGGLDQNQDRIEDALYLVRSALDPNIGGTPPYGAEENSNLEVVMTNIAYHRILIKQTNTRYQELLNFYDVNVINVENIDQLAVITRLLDDQQSLEASYQSMARIRKLSLVNFL